MIPPEKLPTAPFTLIVRVGPMTDPEYEELVWDLFRVVSRLAMMPVPVTVTYTEEES